MQERSLHPLSPPDSGLVVCGSCHEQLGGEFGQCNAKKKGSVSVIFGLLAGVHRINVQKGS